MKSIKIAIVGGGPGGLMLARLLQLKGFAVNVYERDVSRDARVQGAVVDLHFDSGLKVMEAAGLMDAFKERYMPGADKYRMLDKDGRILLDEHSRMAGGAGSAVDGGAGGAGGAFDDGAGGAAAGFGDERFRPEIDRGALRDVLLDGLLPGTVVWDRQFVGMTPEGTGWKLEFASGATATADLVIGADGYRSKVRSYVTDIEPLYSGATIIQGEIDDPATQCPAMYELVAGGNLIGMGIGKTIAVQPRGDGGLTFYAASLYPEGWIESSGIDFTDPAAVCAFLAHYYEGWDAVFFSLFDACAKFVPRPLNYFPLDQDWEAQPNVTLLGDAAHLMPPSGEGVNTAMLDALDLCECLSSDAFGDVRDAIAAYERAMRARAVVLAQEALDGIAGFASPTEESVKQLVQQLGG